MVLVYLLLPFMSSDDLVTDTNVFCFGVNSRLSDEFATTLRTSDGRFVVTIAKSEVSFRTLIIDVGPRAEDIQLLCIEYATRK